MKCFDCKKEVEPILWKSQPIKVCPDCGNVLEAGTLPANFDLANERIVCTPHFHHWEDGSYYSHSHQKGDTPHGHHGSRYGMVKKSE